MLMKSFVFFHLQYFLNSNLMHQGFIRFNNAEDASDDAVALKLKQIARQLQRYLWSKG